jgi:sugar lactone lactonase YvrE
VNKFRRHSILTLTILAVALFTALAAQAAAPNLMAAFFVKGKVGLKWAKVEGVEEYQIFRKDQGGEFSQIGTTDDDHFFDTKTESGMTYVYKIAIKDGGSQVFSGEKTVTIPKSEGEFSAPIWSGVREEPKQIMLAWDKVPGAVAYNVWRSETMGGPYDLVGNSQVHRYADNQDLSQGAIYYYVVSALNEEFEETPQSAEKMIKFGMSVEERKALSAKTPDYVLEPLALTEIFLITDNFVGNPLAQPADLAVNSVGDIYILDTLNGAVECYDSQGKNKRTFGRKATDKTSPGQGEFILPFSIAVDAKDNIYVGDVSRNDIQVFDAGGKYLRTVSVDVSGGQAPLRPNGLHVLDDGRLVMTDAGNHRWLLTSAEGDIILERGGRGADEGLFNFPDQIVVTPAGVVCVVDAINCRIQQFDLEGNFIRIFGEVGQGAGQFGRPKGIGVDGNGMIWVSDGMSNLLQCFTAEGEIKSVVGGADGELRFSSPRGIQFVGGNMLLVERLMNRVSAFSIKS